ncbi:hypothetical protein SRABI106_04089 [Rahnella aquatilis]|nr:hypothetical protein SRABI106_04089 [Rahnella aquatilis]
MAAETVDMTVRRWQATVADINGQLMQGFRKMREEVPFVCRITQVSARVTFDDVVQIREFQRVTQIKHRRIIAD